MSPDLTLLESLSSHRDVELGIEEAFETIRLRSGGTIGVSSRPLGERRSIGWLICHSFGAEHWHLNATDVSVARALSAHGFPVLRFHSQGYGDSERLDAAPSASTHLDDVIDAAAHLRTRAGVDEIGLIGSRFGAATAVSAAKATDASFLALIDPVTSGRRYLRNLMRSRAIVELTTGHPGQEPTSGGSEAQTTDMLDEGDVNLRGFVISREVYEEIGRVDLLDHPVEVDAVLVVQVSRGTTPAPGLARFAESLSRTGIEVTSAIVSGPFAALFGDGHFRSTDDDLLGDTLSEINHDIAESTVAWALNVRPRPDRSGER